MESGEKLEVLKALYKECFDDSEQIRDYLFSTKLGIQNAITCTLKGRLTGALYLVDKPLVYLGRKIKYPYIVALGVSKTQRGHGIASALVKRAAAKVYKSGLPFIGLYPAAKGFYEKLQFATVTEESALCTEGLDFRRTADIPLLLSLYNEAISNLDFCLERTEQSFAARLEEIAADSGEARLIYNQDKPVGYALGGGEEYVIEGNLNYDRRGTAVAGQMARIANLEAAFALTDISIPFAFKVNDGIIEQNNKIIEVENGKVSYCAYAAKEIGIDKLTSLFFGTEKEMSVFSPYFKKVKGQLAEKY